MDPERAAPWDGPKKDQLERPGQKGTILMTQVSVHIGDEYFVLGTGAIKCVLSFLICFIRTSRKSISAEQIGFKSKTTLRKEYTYTNHSSNNKGKQ